MNFKTRSYEKELLDRNDIPFDDIRQNLNELDFINTHLGGHKITIDGLKTVLGPARDHGNHIIHICEIGCGGGDNLSAIHRWCTKQNIKVRFTGIDINPDCLSVARKRLTNADARFIHSDYILTDFAGQYPDIVFSSLFCHHFTNEEVIKMLQWMRKNSAIGFFINDLNRHPLAYYAIQILTGLFSGSRLVKNDAPLSVLRGFREKEWESLLNSAGIDKYAINWKWAFRHLITVINNSSGTGDSISINQQGIIEFR